MAGAELIAAETAKHIAEALDAAMEGPLKEVGNYIADKIRYLRYGSLLKIVEKAENKARARGLALKMPPLKFFVPFCEAASLEEADKDGSLSELWANLLLTSQGYEDSRHLMYLRILKEITIKEAEVLKEIAYRSRATVWSENRSWKDIEECAIFDVERIELFTEELPEDFTEIQIFNAIINCLECPGVSIISLCAFELSLPKDMTELLYDPEREKAREPSIQVLRSLGLIEYFDLKNIRIAGIPDKHIWCDGVRISDLGIAFLEAVSDVVSHKSFPLTANSPEEHAGLHGSAREPNSEAASIARGKQ